MLKKLRIKFITIMMAFVTILLVAGFGLILLFTNTTLEARSDRAMELLSAPSMALGLRPDMYDEVRMPYFTVLLNHRGEIADVNGYYELTDEEQIMDILLAAMETRKPEGVLEEFGIRFARISRPLGEYLIFLDISGQQAAVRALGGGCVLLGCVSFLLFLGLSVLLSRWAIRPVEQAWQQQKQFVADASHELKTPLTVIMTNAELLQSAGETGQDTAQFTDSILTMARQMRTLVEGLLELARVDNGAVRAAFGRVELSRLVEDSVMVFEPVFFERGRTLTARTEPDICVKGSESYLRQVLAVLLDNAMKYSPEGAEVLVTLKRQGNQSLLTVSNPGEPLSKEDLTNIFKRFYRVDKARSRDGSYGLGLSIAQSIVEEHGGKIWAESAGGRNTFCVLLPKPDRPA